MDFSVRPQIRDLMLEVRDWLESKVYPLEPHFLSGRWNDLQPQLEDLRNQVRHRGWWLPQLGSDHGGMGLSLVDYGLLSSQLGRSPLGHYLFNCQAPDAGNMEILADLGTSSQQSQFLTPLVQGKVRSCFGMTEPDHAGSNPVWMSTRAIRDGDEYVLKGRKWFVTGAEGAAFCIVMAATAPDREPHRRASLFIVPTDNPGYRLVRNIPHMGETGSGWTTHSEIELDDCRVSRDLLLGNEGEGFAIAQRRLGPGRIHHCMRWLGICERALELMCRRALARETAPGRALAGEGIVQDWIASSRAEINACRWSVLHAAWLIEKSGVRQARAEISSIKFLVAGVLQQVLDRAIQVHGALGVSDDTPLAFFYRQERAARIYDGPDEVHKLALARRILQRYRQ